MSIVFTKKIQNSLDIIKILLYNKVITQTGVKNMKKLIAILLALIMTLSLFACGDSDKDEKPDDNKDPIIDEPGAGNENEDPGDGLPGEEDGNDEIDNEKVKNPATPEAYGLGKYLATVTISKVTYNVFDNGAVIYDVTCPKDVIEIPEKIEYLMLDDGTAIPATESDCEECVDRVVGEKKSATVKIVGVAAFYDVAASEIKLPNTITSFEENAFRSAASLTKINFPTSLKKIGDKAFAFSGLKNVNIESGIEYGSYVYYACKALTTVTTDSNLTALPFGVFACCENIGKVTLANTLTEIADEAFFCCYNLKTITIPANTLSIGNKSFYACKSLTAVTVPDSVAAIGNFAFYNCVSATKITLGAGVVSVGDFAIYGCKKLTSVVIPEATTTLGKGVFGNLTISAITIPANVEFIPEMAFINTTTLKNVTIEGNITGVLDKAFANTALVSFTVPASVAGNIGTYVFENCKSLKSVKFDCTLENLSKGIFSNCTALTDVVIPEGTAGIKDYAFNNCSALVNLAIPVSVTSIGAYAFNGCELISEIDISATEIASIGTYAFAGCAKITSMVLPAGITQIPSNLFDGCSSLKSVEFLGDVTDIATKGFAGCAALEKVTVSEALKTIGADAFRGCTNLKEINLGEGLTTIDRAAFYNCPNLKELYIGKSVTSISGYAIGFVDSPYVKEGDKAQPVVNENFTAIGYYGTQFEVYVESFKDINGNRINQKGLGRVGDSAFEDFEYVIIGKLEFTESFKSAATGEVTTTVTERDIVKITKYKGTDANVVVPASFDRANLYVVEIAEGAFKGNANVVSVTLPSWLATVGKEAFADCAALTTVEFLATSYTLPEDADKNAIAGELTVGADVFKNSPQVKVYAPTGSYVVTKAKDLGWDVVAGKPPVVTE